MSLVPGDRVASAPSSGKKTGKKPIVLNRTCQGCRNRKTRCIILPEKGIVAPPKCARCTKLSLECVFLPRAVQRKRQRNESRIKELERKLLEIQDSLTTGSPANNDRSASVPSSDSQSPKQHQPWQNTTSPENQFINAAGSQSRDTSLVTSAMPGFIDPVERGLLSETTAAAYFISFCNKQASIYPLVLLPSNTTWHDVQRNRPALFRAVLTSAAGSDDPKLFKELSKETGSYLAERVVMNGEKSLDLAQALLLLSTWYFPPGRFEELKFSQYANMAATMVLDLRSSNEVLHRTTNDRTNISHSLETKEACRTYLACYFLCSSMALSLRRPTALRYGAWVDDCMGVLLSGEVHENDRRLVEWSKLQRIAEESLAVIGFEEDSKVDFSEASTRFVLKSGMDRVTSWMSNLPPGILNTSLLMHYHMILISLHEPALYDGHDLTDFRPPYKLRPVPLAKDPYCEISLEVANALTQCVLSAQQIIHTFLSSPVSYLRLAPVVVYTRVTYASIVLIKFDVSARMPQSVANLLDDHERNPKILLFQVLDKLSEAMGDQHFQVPGTFRFALSKVVSWYITQFEELLSPEEGDIIQPLMHLSVDESPRSQIVPTIEGIESLRPGIPSAESPFEWQSAIGQSSSLEGSLDWEDLPAMPEMWMASSEEPQLDFSQELADVDFAGNF